MMRFVFLLAAASLALAGEAPLRYVKKETARATFRASLDAQRATGVTLGPWHYIGPFPNDKGTGFDTVFPPEKEINLNQNYIGKGLDLASWKEGLMFVDGKTNSLRVFNDNDDITVYLYRTIASDADQAMPVLFGADDNLTVWLNGEKILARRGTRACKLGDDEAVLSLKKGENRLLLKVCQGNGPSGFAFGTAAELTPANLESWLLGRIAQDFPDEVLGLMIERDWFRQDGLTGEKADFKAAAAKALALAKATLEAVGARAALPQLAADLATLEAKHAKAAADADWRALYLETRQLRRAIALADPLLAFDRLLINKRPPPLYSHMCDQYLGRHSRPGPGLVVLDDWKYSPPSQGGARGGLGSASGEPTLTRPLPERERGPSEHALLGGKLPEGSVLHPDLSFDGARVLFSYCDHAGYPRREDRRFWVYEIGVDGTGLRQLTGTAADPKHGWEGRTSVFIEDWDPCYLPGGGFAFVSTRSQSFGRCHGGRYTPAYVLYRADADGSGIRRISFGEANEWDPAVLHDGRIVYTRWDYINRHDTVFQSLWVTRPDGTATAHFYGNATRNPCMTAETRAIPNSNQIVCTATAHHSYTAGSIMAVDPNQGQEGEEPIRRITPEVRFPETEGYSEGAYATPCPLSEDLYLAAFNPDRHVGQGSVARLNAYGIYLIDTLGGRELLYRDPATSCFSPIPVVPRPEPPTLAPLTAANRTDGTFFILDVYRCTEKIEPGSIRRVRVVSIFPQPTASVPTRSAVANEIVKGVLGTVPVNDDGSVAFRAPAELPMLFQLLDANDMAVMSMRSLVYLQPGETMGCVGCHEARNQSEPVALTRPMQVRDIEPAPGPSYDGGFSFARTVQPVLDRYCIRCHGLKDEAPPKAPAAVAVKPAKTPPKKSGRNVDAELEVLLSDLEGTPIVKKPEPKPKPQAPPKEAEKPLNLLGTPTSSFCEAYDSLVARKGLISLAHRNSEKPYSTLKLYGSPAGRLAPLLLGEHQKHVKLDRASWQRLVAWLDLNGQYYGDYARQRPERRKPDEKGVASLRAHVRAQCGGCHADLPDQPLAALINVAEPDESRVLKAPLAEAAGGWGQCQKAFANAAADGFKTLRRKALEATGLAASKPGGVALNR